MEHDHRPHDHDHGRPDDRAAPHGRVHVPADLGGAFVLGVALNLGFVVVEAAYGVWGHSVALFADAGHNLGDALGLIVAFTASLLAKRAPTTRFTYGLRGSSILAALFNAVVLLLTVGAISWEALLRLAAPQPVAGLTVMAVAVLGIAVNGFCAWLFAAGRKGDLNIRGAFMHMAADALVSVGVVVGGLLILLTNWMWIDPLVSLAINAVIVWGTWGLLRDSLCMSMAAVPGHIDAQEVREFLSKQDGVAAIHDLHVWPLSTTDVAMTCHLVMPGGHPGDAFLHNLALDLASRFRIDHPTLQIEVEPHLVCALASDEVV